MEEWANRPNRKPLILRGARQVGKTTAVTMFAKKFDQFISCNLDRPGEMNLFKKRLPVKDLYQALLLEKNLKKSDGRSLLFIDEIQNSPEAVESLRYFYEEIPEIHVIAAGSLLEAMISKNQLNFPVGRVEFACMHPLCFEEFLDATGEEQALEAFRTVPYPAYAYDILLKHFHRFTQIGGMPEIVDLYTKSHDVSSLQSIYQSLLTSFIDDVSKYARNHTQAEVIRHCIENAPLESGKRIAFAGFGRSHYKSREVSEALKTLQRAMLLYLLYPATSTELPILPDQRKYPRLQFLDTGLLNYSVGLMNDFFTLENLHSLYRGIVVEHITGQELIALCTDIQAKPGFWVRENPQANAEVDYIIRYKNSVIPIEVKSGATGSLRSLHQFMDACNHSMAVRLYAGELKITPCATIKGKKFSLLNLPYFFASKITEYLDWAFKG